MAESEDGGGSDNMLVVMLEEVFSLIWEMIGAFFSVLPKALGFILWILAAIVILPCVFIAGHVYPLWAEWGEDF